MSQIQIPNNFSQILTLAKFELLIGIKGKKIPAIFAITIGAALTLLFVPEMMGLELPDSTIDFLLMPLGFSLILFIIMGVLFGSNSLVTEFHERTGYSLFPNPLTRTSIWLGKFLSAEILCFTVISIFYCLLSVVTYSKFYELPNEIFDSFIFSFVTLTMIMSVSFLISSFSRGPTGAAVLVFLLFILALPLVDQFLINYADMKPWFSPTFAQGIIQKIFLVPYPIDLEPGVLPRGPNDFERFVPYVDESLIVMFGYIISFSLASIYLFKRREMVS